MSFECRKIAIATMSTVVNNVASLLATQPARPASPPREVTFSRCMYLPPGRHGLARSAVQPAAQAAARLRILIIEISRRQHVIVLGSCGELLGVVGGLNKSRSQTVDVLAKLGAAVKRFDRAFKPAERLMKLGELV